MLVEPYKSWAGEIERGRWSAFILDDKLRLVHVSDELKDFMAASLGHVPDDDEAGVGLNMFEALLSDAWRSAMDQESVAQLLPRSLGFWKSSLGLSTEGAKAYVPEAFHPFLETAPDAPPTSIVADSFIYTSEGRPPLSVEFLLWMMRDNQGAFTGAVAVNQASLSPNLVSLLSRGDERMYGRMARLAEPRRCQGSILFADLEGSTRLSRTLPTGSYFSFIRSLAQGMDAAIASNVGVVGKHAGDGVSGFFLVGDEDPSVTAASALRAAMQIQHHAAVVLEGFQEEAGVDLSTHGMNVGVHWGSSIFVGQLVPGGRLEVTALGDPVNECARIQEAACDGTLLASKHIMEQLSEADAGELGLDLNKLAYRTVSELPDAPPKSKQDAGTIPVTEIKR